MSRLLISLVVLVLSACQVDVSVDLDVAEDGSGTVTVGAVFDAEANEAIASRLRTSDLQAAGWEVLKAEADDGTVHLSLTKPVSDANGWQATLDEIAGPGVFNDVRVAGQQEFANTSQLLSFELDLSEQWDLFSDDGVAAALDGEPFGAPIESLTGGRSIDEIISVELQTTVVSDNDGTPVSGSYSPRFDSGQPLVVTIESSTENSTAILLRWIAIALFSLFVLATILAITGVFLQRRADRLRPAPTPETLASRVPGNLAQPTAVASASSPSRDAESVRLVIIEPLSVLYRQANPLDEHLLPFVRAQGGLARADTIVEGYQNLIIGSIDTTAFWELCGVPGDAVAIDADYSESRELGRDAGAFFKEVQRRRIPVAATTNDAVIWSARSRDSDRLSAVWPWLVSSEVGALTSNVGIFEVLRRESGIAHGHCLYVDSDLSSLDAAKELGMKTALFDLGDLDLPTVVGHPVISQLSSLFGR